MYKDYIAEIIWLVSMVVICVVALCFNVFLRINFDVEDAVKENNKLKVEFYKETGKTSYKVYSEYLENKLKNIQ